MNILAQQPDILLSEPHQVYEVPLDLRIQDAGRIGNVWLAVWGTVRRQSDTSVIPELVWQSRRDSTTVGVPQRVHSEEARPLGVVRVLLLDNSFLVLWNDRREGDTVMFARIMDTSGTWRGEEFRFSEGRLTSVDGTLSIAATAENLVLWNDSRQQQSGLYGRRYDRQGRIWGAEFYVGPESLSGAMRYHGNGSDVLVNRDSAEALLITADSVVRVKLTPKDRFNHPHYIAEDGTLVVLRDTTLSFYGTVFDTVAYRSQLIPEVVHPSQGFRWPRELFCIVRDSSGRYGVVHPWASTALMMLRIIWVIDDTLRLTDTVHSWNVLAGRESQGTRVSVQRGGSLVRGCGNTYYGEWRFEWRDWWRPYGTGIWNLSLIINSDGKRSSTSGLDLSCDIRSRPSVGRTRSDSVSEISVAGWGRVGVRVPFRNIRLARNAPVLAGTPDNLYVSWNERVAQLRHRLFQWPDLRFSVGKEMGMIVIPDDYRQSAATSVNHSQVLGSNGTCLLYFTTMKEYLDPQFNLWARQSIEVVYYVSDSGWTSIFSENYYQHGTSVFPNMAIGGVDPANRSVLLVNRLQATVRAIDPLRGELWKMSPVGYSPGSTAIIPVGHRDILLINDSTLTRVQNGVVKSLGALKSFTSETNARFVRLADSSVLAWEIDSSVNSRVHIHRFSFTGIPLRDTTLNFSGALDTIAVQINPGDSSVALLCASSHGVRLSYLDRSLNLWRDQQGNALHDLHINSSNDSVGNMSGVFRNDTLLFVWEDYRNGDGIADIYGNHWVVPANLKSNRRNTPDNDDPGNPNPIDSTEQQAITGVQIVAISPNPSTERVAIELRTPEATEARLHLYDMMGREVWRSDVLALPTGSRTMDVEVVGLGPGTYTLVTASQGIVDRRRLVVLH